MAEELVLDLEELKQLQCIAKRPRILSFISSEIRNLEKTLKEDANGASPAAAPQIPIPIATSTNSNGKSSQVPQFLLEENMAPVLCIQPRRFAVIAVAKMVAKARKCELGEEVGNHIGHSKHLSSRAKIVFKTAEVLLDEMRDKGFQALKYKVIILDEVHERSIESDLVLVCVKQFLLKNKDLRVVLMSATADIGRYRDYFRDLGRGDRIEVLGIPSSSQKEVFQRQVSYLEQLKPNLDKELDPMAGIMDLMKNMYEEGDEDMKRTIAKAWTDARSGKTGDSLKGFR